MDPIKMTVATMLAWKSSWQSFNELHRREIQAKSVSRKLDDLSDLLEFAESMGWMDKLRSGEDDASEGAGVRFFGIGGHQVGSTNHASFPPIPKNRTPDPGLRQSLAGVFHKNRRV